MAAACAPSGSAGSASSTSPAARAPRLRSASPASFSTNFSAQLRSCLKDWSSSSPRSCPRTCMRARSTSSTASTTWPMPVCLAPRAGRRGASSPPPAERRASSRSEPLRALALTAAALSAFLSQASSAPASLPAARSAKRSEETARSSACCWRERDSSFSFWRASTFCCWCSRQRWSLSLRCSAQARSTCESTRSPKSLAWCASSCFSAVLGDLSACSSSCFTFASLSEVSFRRCSSHCLVCCLSASWNVASACRISSSCCVHSSPASRACETSSSLTPSGKASLWSWSRCKKLRWMAPTLPMCTSHHLRQLPPGASPGNLDASRKRSSRSLSSSAFSSSDRVPAAHVYESGSAGAGNAFE
mmetsp:Transcript_5662/g.15377  ORF Transcript_5662/g.15377 Transcript_5662/m.15377 type:complete len:361 (+) Transcript_5662:1622-2704(+)